jgi:hypothetical protein
MSPASFTPEQDLHFVLCDFGRSGQAYVETDPTQADASTTVRNLLDGQYNRPVRVLALNVEEGWVEMCRRSSPQRCATWRGAMDKDSPAGPAVSLRRTATLPTGSDRRGRCAAARQCNLGPANTSPLAAQLRHRHRGRIRRSWRPAPCTRSREQVMDGRAQAARQRRDTCPKTVAREIREASRLQSAHSLPASQLSLGRLS